MMPKGPLQPTLPYDAITCSWARMLLSVASYALLLSDVVRSGVAVSKVDFYAGIEPDVYMYFGPYAYSGVRIRANSTDFEQIDPVAVNTTIPSDRFPMWLYKQDTTSLVMRAFAMHWNVSAWSDCVLYKQACESDDLALSEVFHMLDTLVDASITSNAKEHLPLSTTLRTSTAFIDRLHHLILPQIFFRNDKRTNHALYYSSEALKVVLQLSFCHRRPVRPLFCEDQWLHYHRFCLQSDHMACSATANDTQASTLFVWSHLKQRIETLQQQFPTAEIDLLVVEGLEDYTIPAMTFQGRRMFDLVTILRVRVCNDVCTTLLVDDFRYEGAALTSDIVNWYSIVALLRIIAQAYAWLRVLLLLGGYVIARYRQDPVFRSLSFINQMQSVVIHILSIPSQVVIYGSVFPIICYAIAHQIDSAMVYDRVAQAFASPLGILHLDFGLFLRYSAVVMRNVWLIALAVHFMVFLQTTRATWSPVHGIVGITEFSISFLSFWTIFAQYRAISFRQSLILSIHEVPTSRLQSLVRLYGYQNTRNIWERLLWGHTTDLRCLLCAAVGTGAIFLLLSILSRWCCRLRVGFWSRTLVPSSAGWCWSPNGLVVSWPGSVLMKSSVRQQPLTLTPSTRVSRLQIQPTLNDMHHDWKALVWFMNLAMMTDPWTLVVLRCHGPLVGCFQPTKTHAIVLLPVHSMKNKDLQLIAVISTDELTWTQLLTCGS